MNKMRTSKKILIAFLGIAAVIAVIFLARWLIRYRFYNVYREDLTSYEYETGSEFAALQDSHKDV